MHRLIFFAIITAAVAVCCCSAFCEGGTSLLSLSLLSGKWIPNGVLNVIVANTTRGTKKPLAHNCDILLENYMNNAGANWTWACAVLQNSGQRLWVSAVALSAERVLAPTMIFADVVFPELRFVESNGTSSSSKKKNDVPSVFLGGSIWHKFGAPTVCQTNAAGPPQQQQRRRRHRRRHESNPSQHVNKTKVQQQQQQSHSNTSAIRKIHLVMMQHLDVGYTDYVACVVSHYVSYILPGTALAAAADPSYIYTTHPFVLYFFFRCDELRKLMRPPNGIVLVCPSQETIDIVASAVRNRQIVYSRFVFDGFNELLGKEMFSFAFDYANWLDRKFFPSSTNNKAAAAKSRVMVQCDIPGLYGAQLREITETQRVDALYLGQNGFLGFAGAVPGLPRMFLWQPESLTEKLMRPLLVLTHFGAPAYGGIGVRDVIVDDASGSALAVMVTLENHPPYTPGDAQTYLNKLRSEFPHVPAANVRVSTFEDFVDDVIHATPHWPRRQEDSSSPSIPLVKSDIGDPWVRAIPSTPKTVAAFLSRRREFENCVADKGCYQRFDEQLMDRVLMWITGGGVEHNFGMPYDFSSWEQPVLSYIEKQDLLAPSLSASTDRHRHRLPLQQLRGGKLQLQTQKQTKNSSESPSPLTRCHFRNYTVEWATGESGAVTDLRVLDATSNNGSKVLLTLADAEHPIGRLLYVVWETGTPWMEHQNGWGSPMPQLVAGKHFSRALRSSSSSSSVSDGETCSITVEATIEQSYYNNNTKRVVLQDSPLHVTMSFEVRPQQKNESSSSSNPLLPFGLELVASVVSTSGVTPSYRNHLYSSWAETVDIGSAMMIQIFPTVADPKRNNNSSKNAWRITTLGQQYSPYKFHARGFCQYHVADSAQVVVDASSSSSSSSSSSTESLLVDLVPDQSRLLVFGWNNQTWDNAVYGATDPITKTCAPNDSEGVFIGVYNSENANWVVGWPWNEEENFESNFVLRF